MAAWYALRITGQEAMAETSMIRLVPGRWKLVIMPSTNLKRYGGRIKMFV